MAISVEKCIIISQSGKLATKWMSVFTSSAQISLGKFSRWFFLKIPKFPGIFHVSFDLIGGLCFLILLFVFGQMVPIWCFMAPEMFGGVAVHLQLAITAIMVLLGIKYATLQPPSLRLVQLLTGSVNLLNYIWQFVILSTWLVFAHLSSAHKGNGWLPNLNIYICSPTAVTRIGPHIPQQTPSHIHALKT